MKELEKENTTTMVKVVASLPILTKEGSLMIQQQINEIEAKLSYMNKRITTLS
jgi:hypothetical protein